MNLAKNQVQREVQEQPQYTLKIMPNYHIIAREFLGSCLCDIPFYFGGNSQVIKMCIFSNDRIT